MPIEFTAHQKQAIEAEGGSLLVSAAAGSGKTAVLTERVVRLLTGENAIPADRLIIVTFTVAAANEMKKRISDRISALIEENPTDEWLQSQQLLLPRAHISTIHSLCSALIQENMQQLGLSGKLNIAEEADLAVLKRQVAEEVLEEHYAAQEDDFRALLEFTCTKNDKPLTALLLNLYDFIRSFAFPLDFLDKAQKLYQDACCLDSNGWKDEVCLHLVQALDFCIDSLQRGIVEISTVEEVREKYLDAFASDLQQLISIRGLVEHGRLAEAGEAARSFRRVSLSAVRKFSDPDFLERVKSFRKQANDLFANLVKRYLCFTEADFKEDVLLLSRHTETLFGLLREIYVRIEENKRQAELLDYADLEHFTLRLLVEKSADGYCKTELGRELSGRFDEIMIDECQDINEVQNMIFTLLSKEETDLFLVGDVKQSIYRFRKAMPTLFIARQKAYPSYNEKKHTAESKAVIRLEMNFRSRNEVCGIVNHVFSRLMSEEMGEIAYGQEEYLLPGADYPEAEAAPELHIVDYDRGSDEEKSVAEARYLASLIRRMVDQRYPVTDNGTLRPCTYRDFALLLRSYQSKAGIYAAEMKKQNIPCFSESAEGYFDSYEVMAALNLLRVIDNPLQDVPLLSVLLSPVFAFSPDMIARLRMEKKNVPLYLNLLSLAQKGEESCMAFEALLAELRRKAASLRVDALVQEIYDQTDFIALSHVMGDGGQKDANLRLLLTYAGRYEENGRGGLSGFLRYIDRVIASGKDFSCANISSEAANCVRIMSIHKSKGLEFPICILADCGKKFNKMDLNGRSQTNAELGFSMKITDPDTLRSYNSLPFEAIRLKSEKEALAEEMRVLYVAMTRAKEKLILVTTIPNAERKLCSLIDLRAGRTKLSPYEAFQAQSYDEWLLMALQDHPGMAELRRKLHRPFSAVAEADFPLRCILTAPPEVLPELEQTLVFSAEPDLEQVKRLREAMYAVYPCEPLTRLPAKLTPTVIAKQSQEQKIHLNMRPAFLQKQGFTPAQRGTILHSFMQYADFAAAKQDLSAEITRLSEKGFLTGEEASALNRKKIEAFLQSPLYCRMEKADKLLREYKFLYFVPGKEVDDSLPPEFSGEEILIQGIADCLIFEPDGIVIVDYKTDRTTHAEELAERYRGQLRVYREAVSSAFALPVKQCLLYSLHMEQEIEIAF